MTSFFRAKHFLAAAICFCLLAACATSFVSAEEIGIRLTPSVIQIRPQQDGVIEKSLSVENSGRDPLDLGISIRPFTTNNKGEIIYPGVEKIDEETKQLIENDITVLENDIPVTSLRLAPGQKQNLKLKINIKDIQNISQYTFSLFFVSETSGQQASSPEESPIHTELNVTVGSAMHILIFGSKEDSPENLSISVFQTERFIQNGPVHFRAMAKNDSKKYINIHGNITITNMFGQQIGIIRLPNQLIPAGAEKEISGQINRPASTDSLLWPEKLILGSYKARLTLITDTGYTTDNEVRFFAFPVKKIILVLIAFFIASFIIGQVREKVK